MKFKVKAKTLLKVLNAAEKFRSNKALIPALAGFLINVTEDGIAVTAAGSEAAVRVTAKYNGTDMQIDETGTAVFPARLRNIVSACDCDVITVSAPEDVANIRYGGSRFKVTLIPANDYPRFGFPEEGTSFSADAGEVTRFIKSVSFAAVKGGTRPALEGVNLRLKDSVLQAEATDSYRVAVNTMSVDASEKAEGSVLVNAKAMEHLSVFPDSEVRFFIGKNLCFKGEDDNFSVEAEVRTIDAAFPSLDSLMRGEDSCQREFQIRNEILSSAADRASLFAGDDHHIVTFDLKSDKCKLSAQSLEIGSSDEELADCTYTGEGGTYSFDLRYVKEVLKTGGRDDDVKVKFMGDLRPAYFSVGENSGRYVILPVRTF